MAEKKPTPRQQLLQMIHSYWMAQAIHVAPTLAMKTSREADLHRQECEECDAGVRQSFAFALECVKPLHASDFRAIKACDRSENWFRHAV